MFDRAELKKTPKDPGVYLMKDAKGKVIYVGKAKNLSNRVRSYFQKNVAPKTERLVARIESIDFIITASEYEAFVLENNLIKEYRPHYNVLMRDDKTYLYLKISRTKDFPSPEFVRRIEKDGAFYFGPFVETTPVHKALRFLRKLYPYCDQDLPSLEEMKAKKKLEPCLSYRLGLCPGACVLKIEPEEYRKNIEGIIEFFQGNQLSAAKNAHVRMKELAKEKRYEEAARFRDLQEYFIRIAKYQDVVSSQLIDLDVFGLSRQTDAGVVVVLNVRKGRVVNKTTLSLADSGENDDATLIERAAYQYYEKAATVPKEVVLQADLPDARLLQEFIQRHLDKQVKVVVPERGIRRSLVELAMHNAADHIRKFELALKKPEAVEAVKDLQKRLGLEVLPARIEVYDISHFSGTNVVASMVVFTNGRPDKKDYRRFKIKTFEGIDDFESIREVLRRRFAKMDDAKFAKFPDLLVIDGGKGQLSAAVTVLKECKLTVPVISLAKREEEVFIPGKKDSLKLPKTDPALKLLQFMRDEAHRFAVSYHTVLRSKGVKSSLLDSIPGIGNKKRHLLLKTYGSVAAIKQADIDELAKLVGRATAENLKNAL